jgi:multiple sugar transport system permease protein
MAQLQTTGPLRAVVPEAKARPVRAAARSGARLTQAVIVVAVVAAGLAASLLPAAYGPDGAIGLGELSNLLTLRNAGWTPPLSWLGGFVALLAAFVFPREERFIQAVTGSLGAVAGMAIPAFTAGNLSLIAEEGAALGPGLVWAWALLGIAAVAPWAGILVWDRQRPLLGVGWAKWLFVLPAALWVFALGIFPLVFAFTTSRYAYRNGRISRFVGWDNYRRLFEPDNVPSGLLGAVIVAGVAAAAVLALGFLAHWLPDREFSREDRKTTLGLLPIVVVPAVIVYLAANILNDPLNEIFSITFVFVAGAVAIEMVLGLAIALFMNREIRGRGPLRAIMTLPIFATPIALGYLARAIFYEQGGPVNDVLGAIGLYQPPWLSSPDWARMATILVDVWQWTPFVFIIALAGLQSLPQDVIEAAQVDGATGWNVLRYITLPLMAPILWLILLLRSIDAFKVIDIPTGLTLGGPGRATEYFSLFNYRTARKFFDYGGAAAQAFLLLLIVMILVTLLWGRIKHVYEDEVLRG